MESERERFSTAMRGPCEGPYEPCSTSVIHSANMCSALTMCQSFGPHQETKQKVMLALVELLFKWGGATNKHVASGIENRPEACVVQMVSLSSCQYH